MLEPSTIMRLVRSKYDCGDCGGVHEYDDPLFDIHKSAALSFVICLRRSKE
ncbi:MAG: hypothetical protein HY231_24225 [Acidobacteria bacterium]|nr:hypothetical protein [Acidobacteriota bacterium]